MYWLFLLTENWIEKELSQDRWKISKISQDLTELSDITYDKYSVKKKMFKENEDSEESGVMTGDDWW